MNREKIIWTNKMKQLRDEIQGSATGVFTCDLTDEDTRDFVSYLERRHIPVLMFYTIDRPYISGNLYDDDYEVIDCGLDCVAHFVLDAPVKRLLETVDKCGEVRLYLGYEGQPEESMSELEKNTRVISGYTKRVAVALREFSEVGVILDYNELASKMMGEFFPGYSSSENTNNTLDKKIVFSRSRCRFSKGKKECDFRKKSSQYIIFQTLLAERKEKISYSSLSSQLGRKDTYRTKNDEIESIKKYAERKFKNELGWEKEVLCLDRKNSYITLSPEFRDAVVIAE